MGESWPLKCLMAAPAAVSSWMTACPLSVCLGLTIISSSIPSSSITRLRAERGCRCQGIEEWRGITFEVDPQVVGIEDLELADWETVETSEDAGLVGTY